MDLRLLLPDVLRPVTRLIGRGTGQWLNFCGGGAAAAPAAWQHAPRRYRVFYDKRLGAYFSVDLAEWYGRLHYYSGRYFDLGNFGVIKRFLSAGDAFVDIGAHYGIHSLTAARAVGATGRVISFEPNPPSFRLLQAHIALNRLSNVTCLNLGLSDVPGELSLAGDDTIRLSLRHGAGAPGAVRVRVEVGDEALKDYPLPGRLLVKIDTEGFEHHVIRGLTRVLDRADVAVAVEITDGWLKQTGSSAADLFADLRAGGFDAYLPHARGASVDLRPLGSPLDLWQYDVLFAKPAFLQARAQR